MSTSLKTFPAWAFLSIAANGLLILAVILLLWREHSWLIISQFRAFATQPIPVKQTPLPKPILGPRHQLTYQQWVDLIGREAAAAAEERPNHLTVLVGDSLSLWFPTELLPAERSWLNQGISGETSAGLLERLHLLDRTQPETIFVMIGINDLIRGMMDETILENQRLIMRYLRRIHPQSQIVVQSILPHSEEVTWEGRNRLLAVANSRIRQLNERLKTLAAKEGVSYLDLYPLFVDGKGDLRPELTTDGLHLSHQGYIVWRSALMIFSQLELEQGKPSNQQR